MIGRKFVFSTIKELVALATEQRSPFRKSWLNKKWNDPNKVVKYIWEKMKKLTNVRTPLDEAWKEEGVFSQQATGNVRWMKKYRERGKNIVRAIVFSEGTIRAEQMKWTAMGLVRLNSRARWSSYRALCSRLPIQWADREQQFDSSLLRRPLGWS